MSADRDKILPQHQELINESAIDPEVARERGYFSAEKKVQLKDCGFGQNQQLVPALVIPIYDVHGELVTYQARPDQPRVKDRRALKYETPGGSRLAIDVPPLARRWLGDPSRPLLITEGARKADAGVSAGLCTVALLGVWGWRGSNAAGGKLALPAWDSIALNDRQVYIVFDSDVVTKIQVHRAMARLKEYLESRGARVSVIYLAHGEGGTKVGLDDFLAAEGTSQGLLALASTELRPISGGEEPDHPYAEENGQIVQHRADRQGNVTTIPLANFLARIVADIVLDDGAEIRRCFEIHTQIGEIEKRFEVTVPHFHSMSWVIQELGPTAIVSAGLAKKDCLREAIQRLSAGDIPHRRIYAHTGWKKIDERWIYLHAGGAIGAAGTVEGVEVRLESPLDRFSLPAPPSGDDLGEAVRISLRLLDGLAADRTMFPLFSILARAVLGGADFSVHLVGKTGARKTELAALCQRFFGAGMDAGHLPGSWSSTANSNEDLAFRAKDTLLAVDDFNPTGSIHDVRRMHRDADRLLRAQGNRSGRGRMRSDGTLREPRPPRGLILSTGEDIPAGHSLRARVLVIEVDADEVDLDRLTELQAAGAMFSRMMAALVQWLAPRLDEVRDALEHAVTTRRQELLARTSHGRTATIGAQLLFSLEVLLEFAQEAGALDAETAAELAERGSAAILEQVDAQQQVQEAADPAQLFQELIGAALRSGAVHLVSIRDGGCPDSDNDEGGLARAVGWRFVESEDPNRVIRSEWRPGGPRVGWVEEGADAVFLIPEAVYKAAQAMGSDAGSTISLTQKRLWKALHSAGVLVSTDADRRHTRKKRVEGRLVNTLHLRLSQIIGGSGTSGTPDGDSSGDAKRVDLFPESVPEDEWPAGTQNGNEAIRLADPSPPAPTVPDVPEDGGMSGGDDRSGVRPPETCFVCGERKHWRLSDMAPWTCARCHPHCGGGAEIEWCA